MVGDVGYDRLDLEMECCDLVTMENRNNPWRIYGNWYMGVSKNGGTPKSSIFIGFSK